MTNQTIIALYDDKASARQVLEELRTAGYGDEFWISGDSSYGSTGTGRFSSLNSDFSVPNSRTAALTRLGVPEDEAHVYSEAVRRGGVLLVGQVDDSRTQDALDIIERHGPVDASERGNFYRQSGWTSYDATAADYDETTAAEERSRYGSGITAAATGLRDVNTTGTGTGTKRSFPLPRKALPSVSVRWSAVASVSAVALSKHLLKRLLRCAMKRCMLNGARPGVMSPTFPPTPSANAPLKSRRRTRRRLSPRPQGWSRKWWSVRTLPKRRTPYVTPCAAPRSKSRMAVPMWPASVL
jgi:hypothetical protein